MSLLARRHCIFLARVRDIAVYLHFSWFLIAALVTFALATELFPQVLPEGSRASAILLGSLGAALFFTSILLHEFGHAVVSQRCGIPVPRITLFFIGGVAEMAHEPQNPRAELKIALGGPAVSLILVGLFAAGSELCERSDSLAPAYLLAWLAATNLALAVFNLFPGYPLDGGRVLRAILWSRGGDLVRATFIASRLGLAFSWLLIAGGAVAIALPPHPWNALVLVLIGSFLRTAAQRGYEQVARRPLGKTADEITPQTPLPQTAPGHETSPDVSATTP